MRLNTSHKEIFEYWKDKCISNKGNVYIDYGYEGYDKNLLDKNNTESVIYDWGEPCCWACGATYKKIYENPNYERSLEEEYPSVWNFPETRSFLNRCHIIPRSRGGSDDASNLFLLCARCHKESPDTRYKDLFLKWVWSRKHEKTLYIQAEDILRKDYDIYVAAYGDDFNKKVIDAIGTHKGEIVTSTLISAYVGVLRENYEDLYSEMPHEIEAINEKFRNIYIKEESRLCKN